MTDRLNALLVVLDENVRDDDAEGLIDAIKRIRGVLDVRPNVARIEDAIAYSRAKHDISERLYAALKEEPSG